MGEKLKIATMGIGAALTIPLMVLNWSAAIVGGIWLAIDREWSLLTIGTAIIFLGHFLLSWLMMIGIAIAAVAAIAKWAIIRWPIVLVAFLFYLTVMTIWAVTIFNFAINRPHGNAWPYILWAYAVSTVPWTQMAQGETNTGTFMLVAATQFGALAVMAAVLIGDGNQSVFGMELFFVFGALFGMAVNFMVHRSAV